MNRKQYDMLYIMTAEDKKNIYMLLKTASSALCGYVPADFSGPDPVFSADDTAAQASSVSAGQSECPVHAPLTLASVAAKVNACTRCDLHARRLNAVPGTGCEHPFVLVVGEGPGAEEDMQGLPFVGPAGKLLDKMLAAISLDRHTNCYIANIVKCRPPNNRTPLPEEADACISFLEAQIHILKPKMILAAGRTAGQNLLKTQSSLTNLRGRFYDYQGIPLLVTYHPSALLRDETLKRPAWEDLKLFRAKLLEIAPGYAGTPQRS